MIVFILMGFKFDPANNTWLFYKFDIICLYKNIFFTTVFWSLIIYNILYKTEGDFLFWRDKLLDTKIGLIFILATVAYNFDENLVPLKMIEFIGVSFFISKIL